MDELTLPFSIWLFDLCWLEQLLGSTIELLQSLPDTSFEVITSSSARSSTSDASTNSTPTPPGAIPSIQEELKGIFKRHGAKQKAYYHLLRYAITGTDSGPSISLMIATLGRQRAIQRIQHILKHLETQ
jgi:lysyl-tRNA synthetase class I